MEAVGPRCSVSSKNYCVCVVCAKENLSRRPVRLFKKRSMHSCRNDQEWQMTVESVHHRFVQTSNPENYSHSRKLISYSNFP